MKHRLGLVTVCAVLVLASAACSGEDPAPGATGAETGSSAGGGASTAPSAAPSAEEPPTPEVEPASGPDLTQTNLRVRAPQGWELKQEGDPFSGQATDGLSSIFVTEIEDFGDGLLDISEQARIAVQSGPYLQKPKILDPVEIDGREWYHIAGPTDRVRHIDAFGTSEDGVSYSVDISLQRELISAAEREAIVASVLASIEIG